MENVDYLYHYTSIESLALILKNRTIRFNSLEKMDDLQEKETADIKNASQFCYISSWTATSIESIPMWNMYASLNLGVRIKLRKNPFKIYNNSVSDLSKISILPVIGKTNGEGFPTIIPFAEMFSKGFFSFQAISQDILFKMEYTNDHSKLYPCLYKELQNGQFSIDLGKLGKHKNLHWEFQDEWRYILNFLPFNLNAPIAQSLQDFQVVANRVRLGLEHQPFPYYDMVIDESAFLKMEITLSPCISAGSKIIVEALKEKFNPTATIIESELKCLI